MGEKYLSRYRFVFFHACLQVFFQIIRGPVIVTQATVSSPSRLHRMRASNLHAMLRACVPPAARSVAVPQQSGVAAYVPGVSSSFSPAGRPAYCQPRNRRAGQGP